MKSRSLFPNERIGWHWAALLGLWVAASTLWAAETNAPAGAVTNAAPATATNAPPSAVTNAPAPAVAAPRMTPEQMFEGGTNAYNNWIEFGVGGFFRSGNKAQHQQWNQTSGGAFGGIEDFHYQADLAKGTTIERGRTCHLR